MRHSVTTALARACLAAADLCFACPSSPVSFSSFLAAPTREGIHGPLHLQDLESRLHVQLICALLRIANSSISFRLCTVEFMRS